MTSLSLASASGSGSRVTITQREIKSCGYCYRRKVKCNKVFPCSRCTERGLADLCEQQTALVNFKKKKQAPGSPAASRVRRPPTHAELVEENKSLQRQLAAKEKALNKLLAVCGRDDEPLPVDQGLHEEHDYDQGRSYQGGRARTSSAMGSDSVGSREQDVEDQGANPQAAPSVELIHDEDSRDALGDGHLDYLSTVRQVFGLQTAEEDGSSTSEQPKTIFTERSRTTLDALHVMVPLAPGHSDFLIQYHCSTLHWIHGVFHIPSSLGLYQNWIVELKNGSSARQSYDFLALYFAIIACSLHFLDETDAERLGLSQEAIGILPRFWFNLSINCLQLSDFMVRPTFPILQTICILPMIAHAFDASKYMSSMMHCALGLAQELNLHLLAADSSHVTALGTIHAELGRRIWWCLKIRECMNPGTYHMTNLLYPAALTSPPANIDDADLIEGDLVVSRPYDQVTNVSYLIALGLRADVFREFTYGTGRDQSLSSRYQCMKRCDRKLQSVLAAFPDLQPRCNDERPTRQLNMDSYVPFDYRPWARFINATSMPCCRIILHQQFLTRSYEDNRFALDREICLESARAIMMARRRFMPMLFQKNWHVSSETIIAAMTFAIDLLRGRHDRMTKAALRSEINEAIFILQNFNSTNIMIPRGVTLLQKLLAEEEVATASEPAFSTSDEEERQDGFVDGDHPWINFDFDAGDDLFNTLLQM